MRSRAAVVCREPPQGVALGSSWVVPLALMTTTGDSMTPALEQTFLRTSRDRD
jgi:hypothetical protein